MARLMFSFREERLVCEADWAPTVSAFGPRALKIKNIKIALNCTALHYTPDLLFLYHLGGRVHDKPEVGDDHQTGGAAEEDRHRGIVSQGDHEGENQGEVTCERREHISSIVIL